MDDVRGRPTILNARNLLWAHAAAVAVVTSCLSSAGGEFRALHSPLLFGLLIPAIYSLGIFPPVVLYTTFRESGGRVSSVVAEALLTGMHILVVYSGFIPND
ncbi:MAG: hypothetical protein U0992_23135 [Planctomycetaceae bacterium]